MVVAAAAIQICRFATGLCDCGDEAQVTQRLKRPIDSCEADARLERREADVQLLRSEVFSRAGELS